MQRAAYQHQFRARLPTVTTRRSSASRCPRPPAHGRSNATSACPSFAPMRQQSPGPSNPSCQSPIHPEQRRRRRSGRIRRRPRRHGEFALTGGIRAAARAARALLPTSARARQQPNCRRPPKGVEGEGKRGIGTACRHGCRPGRHAARSCRKADR